jgi:hypothetical protein
VMFCVSLLGWWWLRLCVSIVAVFVDVVCIFILSIFLYQLTKPCTVSSSHLHIIVNF